MSDEHDIDSRRRDDGRKVFVVGAVERWVIGAGATLLVTASVIFAQSLTSSNVAILNKLESMQNLSNQIVTGQAVAANDMAEVKTKQLFIQQQITKIPLLEVRVEQHEQQLKELRGNR